MSALYERVVALVIAIGLLVASGRGCERQSYEEALADFAADRFADTDDGHQRRSRRAAIRWRRRSSRRCRTAACCSAPSRRRSIIREPSGTLLDAATGTAGRRRRAGRPQAGPHQQPAAPRDRGRARRPDPAVARSGAPARSGAGGVQVARRQRACRRSTTAIAKETDADGQARADRGARRRHPVHAGRQGGRQARRRRGDPRARRPGGARRCWRACRPTRRRRSMRAARDAIAAIQNQLAIWDARAERLVRALARLGAAARRDRACHHLRRDGRHQHGARRDGDARRLCDLRRAGDHPRAQSGAVRLFARHRHPARLPGRRASSAS